MRSNPARTGRTTCGPPRDPPTRERCQDNDHYSSAKLAANAKNAHLCAITGDGDEWMVVRIVETAALPQSVQLQLVGFFPK